VLVVHHEYATKEGGDGYEDMVVVDDNEGGCEVMDTYEK